MGIEYAILMPTVWKYVQSVGGSKTHLGLLLAGFSMTRTISFLIVGYWSDRRPMREPFIFSFILGAIGSLLYGLAGGLNSLGVMMLGRLVAGIGAANTTLNQTYIARTASADRRTKLLSFCRGCAVLGIASGPLLNLFLLKLDDSDLCTGRFCLNSMTSAGYVMAIVNMALCLSFMVLFVEPPPQASSRSISYQRPDEIGTIQESKYHEIEEVEEPTAMQAINIVICQRAGWFCLMINFVTGFEMTALETAVTPITAEQYGWGTQENSYLFGAITVLAIMAIVSTIVFDKQKCCSPRLVLVLAQVSLGIAFAVALGACGGPDIPLWGLFTFGGFLVYGVVLQATPALGVYSTMIGDFDKGVFMGYSQIVLGVARILGPLFAGVTLEFHTHWLLMATACAVYVFTPVSFPFVWKKIVKHADKGSFSQAEGSVDVDSQRLLKDQSSDFTSA